MTEENLLKKTLLALFICLILVIICYYFVDKPVATFFYSHQVQGHRHLFKWLPRISALLKFIVPIAIIVLALKAISIGLTSRLQKTLFALFINLVIIINIKDFFKFIFGRYSPINLSKNLPSWLKTHAYGFHPFHFGPAYQSFPSGHSTMVFAISTIIWLTYPRLRWLCILATFAVIAGLLMLNYHFVSDIIAGAFLGTVSGIYAIRLFSLNKEI